MARTIRLKTATNANVSHARDRNGIQRSSDQLLCSWTAPLEPQAGLRRQFGLFDRNGPGACQSQLELKWGNHSASVDNVQTPVNLSGIYRSLVML